jgi:hypothetical protein
MALLAAGIPLLLIAGCTVRSHLWWTRAERAVAEAVRATAAGRAPRDIDVRVTAVTSRGVRWDSHADFRTPYTIKDPNSYLLGTSPLTLFEPSLGSYAARLVFTGGHEYRAEVTRVRGGRWRVALQPADGQ